MDVTQNPYFDAAGTNAVEKYKFYSEQAAKMMEWDCLLRL